MGNKAADMLRLVPDTEIEVIERCSGHGGSWGMMKDNFDTALKIGRPVARRAAEAARSHVASECPLAAIHIGQGMGMLDNVDAPAATPHPIELMARSYGIGG
jgi:glycerol-3-phosphate dehydrogenase subunit C